MLCMGGIINVEFTLFYRYLEYCLMLTFEYTEGLVNNFGNCIFHSYICIAHRYQCEI